MKKILWVLALVPFLMAAKCDGVSVAPTCPQAKTYSRDFLASAAYELEVVAPQAPHLVQMLKDYDVTLQAIRYCIKNKMAKKK